MRCLYTGRCLSVIMEQALNSTANATLEMVECNAKDSMQKFKFTKFNVLGLTYSDLIDIESE